MALSSKAGHHAPRLVKHGEVHILPKKKKLFQNTIHIYILLLGKWQTRRTIFSMCLFLLLTLYIFRAYRAHHQERQIVSIHPLLTVTLCRWPCHVQVGSSLPTSTRHGHKYIERNLCVTLVINQESLHDARSTKYKI